MVKVVPHPAQKADTGDLIQATTMPSILSPVGISTLTANHCLITASLRFEGLLCDSKSISRCPYVQNLAYLESIVLESNQVRVMSNFKHPIQITSLRMARKLNPASRTSSIVEESLRSGGETKVPHQKSKGTVTGSLSFKFLQNSHNELMNAIKSA
jgi:hypothetical protein